MGRVLYRCGLSKETEPKVQPYGVVCREVATLEYLKEEGALGRMVAGSSEVLGNRAISGVSAYRN